MTQEDIQLRVESLLINLGTHFGSGTFLYDGEIPKIQEELAELRALCNHQYKNGNCVFCKIPDPEKI